MHICASAVLEGQFRGTFTIITTIVISLGVLYILLNNIYLTFHITV